MGHVHPDLRASRPPGCNPEAATRRILNRILRWLSRLGAQGDRRDIEHSSEARLFVSGHRRRLEFIRIHSTDGCDAAYGPNPPKIGQTTPMRLSGLAGDNWGWGAFKYNAESDTFWPADMSDAPPQANDAKCGLRATRS